MPIEKIKKGTDNIHVILYLRQEAIPTYQNVLLTLMTDFNKCIVTRALITKKSIMGIVHPKFEKVMLKYKVMFDVRRYTTHYRIEIKGARGKVRTAIRYLVGLAEACCIKTKNVMVPEPVPGEPAMNIENDTLSDLDESEKEDIRKGIENNPRTKLAEMELKAQRKYLLKLKLEEMKQRKAIARFRGQRIKRLRRKCYFKGKRNIPKPLTKVDSEADNEADDEAEDDDEDVHEIIVISDDEDQEVVEVFSSD
ncbi:unnamed protein product [Dimorphilus gyrociliatus]|nr:unnamed protein product [Dimorphilus gyrociliatus]